MLPPVPMSSAVDARKIPPPRPPPRRGAAPPPSPTHTPSTPSVAEDDDPTKGEWLFKEDELVLGPVTAIILVERIKKGELSADTPIARDGQPFQPMKLVALFREAWEAAQEERRLAAEERAYLSAVRRARGARVALYLLVLLVPAAGAGLVARQVMIARPWDTSASWLQKAPPLVDLPNRPPEVKTNKVASVDADRAVPDDLKPEAKAEAKTEAKTEPDNDPPDRRRKKDDRRDSRKDDRKDDKKTKDAKAPIEEPKGPVQETLTNEQAIAPLKSIKDDLKGCFKAEMESNPDMPATVVLSYTVTEDGKATNVALDARELRGRPVVGCVTNALGKLRWPRFTGERKNVSVPFKLSKPTPPK